MSERIPPESTENGDDVRHRRPLLLHILVGIVALEALALVASTVWLTIELFVARASALSTALALTVLTALVAAWVLASAIGLWHRRSWSRGSALTWQILQIALAFGAVQGDFAQPGIGALLLAPSLAAIGLIVSRSVRAEFDALDA